MDTVVRLQPLASHELWGNLRPLVALATGVVDVAAARDRGGFVVAALGVRPDLTARASDGHS